MNSTPPSECTPGWVWQQLRQEAVELGSREPVLSSFYHACIVNHDSLAAALGYHLASKMDCDDVPAMLIQQVFEQAFADDPDLEAAVAADICAYYDRDPACDRYSMPLLYFKGFQAVQAYRVAHWLWRCGRRSLALFLQHRIAMLFDVDIHPAAQLGRGIMVDHATGLVIGETAVVADNVSMLHSVTLGGSGCGDDRHPTIGPWVLISAGAKVLGGVQVGEGAKIGAGSVVLEDVAAHTTVVGVPAISVGRARDRPASEMDQHFS